MSNNISQQWTVVTAMGWWERGWVRTADHSEDESTVSEDESTVGTAVAAVVQQ